MSDDDPSGSPLIAVVDNDASARQAIAALVCSFGFGACKFASAAEFLRTLPGHGVVCLITDVQMPGMTGLELHRYLASNGDAIPTILTTAYPNEATRIRALKEGYRLLLRANLRLPDALERMAALQDPLVDEMAAFVRASKRGFAHAAARDAEPGPD